MRISPCVHMKAYAQAHRPGHCLGQKHAQEEGAPSIPGALGYSRMQPGEEEAVIDM